MSSDLTSSSADHLQQNSLPVPKSWKIRPLSEKRSALIYSHRISACAPVSFCQQIWPVQTKQYLSAQMLPSWAQNPPVNPSLFKQSVYLTVSRTPGPSPTLGITNISSNLHSNISLYREHLGFIWKPASDRDLHAAAWYKIQIQRNKLLMSCWHSSANIIASCTYLMMDLVT